MPKPVLLTVDDDPEVLRAVERDLRKQYADRYRVVRADSGASALQSLQTLKKRNEAVALLLVDQRMPEMSGVEFLNKAIAIFPEAKRVLLTAYADTDAAIQAINQARIQHYLLKPWDPPEDQLYPVLDDLLEDWHAGLAAGVYGASEGLTTVMIEREAPGGQAGMSSRIENYLGFPSGISGSL